MSTAGVNVPTILGDIGTSALLGIIGFSWRRVHKDIIKPVREIPRQIAELKADFSREIMQLRQDFQTEDIKFQKKITRRMKKYEKKAHKERLLQIQERERVKRENV